MDKFPDQYLGDGVYASTDGYHIILDLRAQDTTTRIALEPEVLAELNRYVKQAEDAVKARQREQQAALERSENEERAAHRLKALRKIVEEIARQCNATAT